MNALTIVKAKEIRGRIIRYLYERYGEPVPASNANNVLKYDVYHDDNDMKKALLYLSGAKKEYVEIKHDDKNFWSSLIQLTPTGINLAEGDITDMGVLLHG